MADDPFTIAIHGDRGVADGADLAPPIHVTSTYDRADQDELVYRRNTHRTTQRLEAVLGSMEGGLAVAYPSGMAATAGLLRQWRPRRVCIPDDVYHGTRNFVHAEAERGVWEVAARDSLGPGDVLWIETPSNPKGLITDITAAAAEAHAAGALAAVDSTIAGPALQQPLAHGADAVIHSTTKSIGGHSDAMGGVVVAADPELGSQLAAARVRDGAIPGALDVWLTLRGVRTLPLRAARCSESAAAVAGFLADQVGAGPVTAAWYPGLPTQPGHDVALRQMTAFGAVVSFELADAEAAVRVLDGLQLFRRATSLGGVESTVEHRLSVNPQAPPGLLRLSIGLEAPGDLIADLTSALR